MKFIGGWWWPDTDEKSHIANRGRQIAALDETLSLFSGRSTCIQAGGAVGVWPEYLAGLFDHVVTYEPDAKQFECLEANIVSDNVSINYGALGATVGLVGTSHNNNRCNASYIDDSGADVVRYALDDTRWAKESIDFICLDCEGYEYFALQGMERILYEQSPTVQVEDKHGDRYGVLDEDIDSLMASWGYTLVHTYRFDKVFQKCS